MPAVKQLAIILVVCLAGEFVSGCLPVTVPGSVVSMVLMLALLFPGFLKPEQVEDVAEFLLRNMALFFVPLGAGVVECYPLLRGRAAVILAISVVTTVLTFAAAAFAARAVAALIRDETGASDHA